MAYASIPLEVLIKKNLKKHDDVLSYLSAALNDCEPEENPKDFFIDAFDHVLDAQGGLSQYAQVTGNGLIQDYNELLECRSLRLMTLKKIAHSLQCSLHVEEGLLPEEDAPVSIKPLRLSDQKEIIEKINTALDNYSHDPATISSFAHVIQSVIEDTGGDAYLCEKSGISQWSLDTIYTAQTDIMFSDFLCILKALGLDIVFNQHTSIDTSE